MNYLNQLRVMCATLSFIIPSLPLFCCSDVNSTSEAIDPLVVWSQGNKHFTTSFYSHVKNDTNNLVFSPISLQFSLAMTAELALESTQDEIIKTAILPESESTRRIGAKYILERLNTHASGEDESYKFTLANGAWISTEAHLPLPTNALLTQFYQTELRQIPFHVFPEERRKEINEWVEEKTQHQIQNLLPQGSIDAQTKLVLVNTLYMHAPWDKPFNPDLTYEAPFYGLEKSLQPIPYMRKIGKFGLLEEANFIVVEIPFKSSDQESRSFFVILPHKEFTLEELEERLTTRRVAHWMTNTTPRTVDLSLPKFKISSCIDAKQTLIGMGMERPFSQEAEFDLGDQNHKVMITDIVHQAVFEIDELGGTGSAGTGIIIQPTSYQESAKVVIDRPFLFFVADKKSGMILFAGRMMQPKN
jgi:serpin B